MTTEKSDDWLSSSGRWSDQDDDLSSDLSSEDPGSPVWMLWLAVATVAVSIGLFIVGEGLVPNVVGYVLGSVVAFSLVALFSREARRRLFKAGIGTGTGVDTACVLVLVVGLLSVALHAYFIARHYS
jgi:hypothetical protein